MPPRLGYATACSVTETLQNTANNIKSGAWPWLLSRQQSIA
jgi:hypothetical protein